MGITNKRNAYKSNKREMRRSKLAKLHKEEDARLMRGDLRPLLDRRNRMLRQNRTNHRILEEDIS